MAPTPLVDIVIPSWNKRELLLECLRSVEEQSVSHRVFVVDNGSEDGSAAAVRASFPAVVVLDQPVNLGFGRAVNIGIRAGDAPFVLVLNNDVAMPVGFLDLVIAGFDAPDVGCVSPAVLSADGSHIDAVGIQIDRSLAGYSALTGEPVAALTGPPPRVHGPFGAAAVIRRSALEDVGLFDEEIFAYNEDTELVLRLVANGWRTRVVPAARILHAGSATLGRRSLRQLELSGWGRGYVLGRYRVFVGWLVMDLLVGGIDAVTHRSLVPLSARLAGYRRGRALPPRRRPAVPPSMALVEAWSARLSAFRRQ